MRRVGYFLAGFASGWVVRSTVDASRDVPVRMVSMVFALSERVRRSVAMERERIEDIVAEGRARYESRRGRHAGESSTSRVDEEVRGPRAVRKPGERAA